MLYTVGEMAKILGVAPSTLRYYDKVGLLPFVERSENGIRLFKEEDYEWLKIIECLKKTGMSLENIKEFIFMAMQGDETINGRLEMIIKQRDTVQRKIAELEETLDTLEYKQWYYETAKKAGTTEVFRKMSEDELPPKFAAVRKKLQQF